MDSSSEPRRSHPIEEGVRPSMATSSHVPVRNVSVVEIGVTSSTTTNTSSTANVGVDSLNNSVGDVNTASGLALDGNIADGPTAIPADDGDVPQPLESIIGKSDAVTPRGGEDGHVAFDFTDTNSNGGDIVENGGDNQDDGDDESDYSYDYEEEDETNYSGFLIPTEPVDNVAAASESHASSSQNAVGDSNINVVAALDDEKNAALESTSTSVASGACSDGLCRSTSRVSTEGDTSVAQFAYSNSLTEKADRKQKWKEPNRAAVNMSLRAEKEKTGGRRRLASDLYRIMMADTKDAGFSLEPCDEDSMDKWSIKLFGFDKDSNLAKDMLVLGMEHIELEMSFPDQYPFEPPFVRVVRPRFKKGTGFVMSGALCMELLTKDGWNPINDIESVIVSIRSLMVVGDGRLQNAIDMGKARYEILLKSKTDAKKDGNDVEPGVSNNEDDDGDDAEIESHNFKRKKVSHGDMGERSQATNATKKASGGTYTAAEASAAYDHLSRFHQNNGWDKSGWWARKG